VHETDTVHRLHHLPDPAPAGFTDARGDHAQFPLSGVRTVRVLHPTAAAVVLGSSQSESVVDPEAASRLGLAVARRRSGGGAVLVVPGEQVWIDLLIPRGDPLWHDDIVKAAEWVGHAWVDALALLGIDNCEVHTGRLVSTPWSDRVCFAGLGPGEVTVGGAKVMGLSQRRGRSWIRIQSAVHLSWHPAVLVEALQLTPQQRVECLSALGDRVVAVDSSDRTVVDSILSSLPV